MVLASMALPIASIPAQAATALSVTTSGINDAVVGQPFHEQLQSTEASGVTWSVLPMPVINADFHDSASSATWDNNSSSNYNISTVQGSVYNEQTIIPGKTVTFHYQGSLAGDSSVIMNFVVNNDYSKDQAIPMTKLGNGWDASVLIPSMDVSTPTNLVTLYFNSGNSWDSNGGSNYQFPVGTSAALTPGQFGTFGYEGSQTNTSNPPIIMHWGFEGWTNGWVFDTPMTSTGGSWNTTLRVPGALPPGLTLSSNGEITGTPTESGTYYFQVQASDGTNTATYWYSMNVLGQSLSPATVGAAYPTFAPLTADGGTAPYSWQSVTGSVYGTGLPTGMTLSSGGVVGGIPTTAGTYYFTASAQDVTGAVYNQLENMVVNSAPTITTTNSALPAATANQSYSEQLSATGGTAPLTWTIGSGQLPAGLTLSSSGLLQGMPTQTGSFTFQVQLADMNGATATQSYTLDVSGQSISLDTTSVKAGYGPTTINVTGNSTAFSSQTTVSLSNSVNGTVYIPSSSITVSSPTTLSIALPTGNNGLGAGTYTLTTSTSGQNESTTFMVTPYTTTATLDWDGLYMSQSAPYLSTANPTPGQPITIGFRAYSGNVVSASLNIYDTQTSKNTIVAMTPGKTWGPYQLWTATTAASNGGSNWYRVDIQDAAGNTIACFSGDGLHASDTNNNNFPVPFSSFSFNTLSANQGDTVTASGGNADFGLGKVIVNFLDSNGHVVGTATGKNGGWSSFQFTVPSNLPFGMYTVQADDQNVDSNGIVNTDVVREASLVVGSGSYWFDALKHDSTNTFYRTPTGAVPSGTPITLRLRSIPGTSNATLMYWAPGSSTEVDVPMTQVNMSSAQIAAATGDNAANYSWWQAAIPSSASEPAPVTAVVAGDFQTLVGASKDWNPASTHTTMKEVNPNLYQLTVQLPAGSYQYKVALNDSWSVNYPSNNVILTVPSGGATVTISYVPSINGVYDSINNPGQVFPPASTGGLMWYQFKVQYNGQTMYYTDNGSQQAGVGQPAFSAGGPSYQISVYDPSYQTPDWLKHAVIYEIFPDRFFNGNIANDENPNTQKGVYVNSNGTEQLGPIQFHKNWYGIPFDPAAGTNPAYAGNGQYSIDYFGGDLQGIQDKLDYLQSLGVNTLYMTPIFQSESVHKYDTANFTQIDPGFGTMQDYLNLVKAAKARGMHIILDTAFEDTGSDSVYFNRFGAFGNNGAYQNGQPNTSSPYYQWFEWAPGQKPPYSSWWGYDTLPLTNTNNASYQNFADNTVGQYWIEQGASGWRLDSADNGNFSVPWWNAFRQAVKKIDPNAAIIGEIWNNASNDGGTDWLTGSTFDSVMNYQFRNAVLDFFQGNYNDGNEQHNAVDAAGFNQELMTLYNDYPLQSFYAMMNLVDSHDTMRILSVLENVPSPTNMTALQQATYQPTAAQQQLGIEKLKLVSDFQFGFPGDPTVYYGDEAGVTGYKDPLNRGTYPWGLANQDLLNHYRKLGAIRDANPVLQTGTFAPLYMQGNVYAFARTITGGKDVFGDAAQNASAVVAMNNSASPTTVTIPVNGTIANGTQMLDELNNVWYTVQNGSIAMNLAAYQGAILVTPTAPISYMQNNATATSTQLAWTPVAGATAYQVYEEDVSNNWQPIGHPLPASQLSYDVTSLRDSNAITLKVTATTSSDAIDSNITTVPAVNLVMGSVSQTTTTAGDTLSWNAVPGASQYIVYDQQADGSYAQIATVPASNTSTGTYTDPSGTASTLYKVAASNEDNYSVSQRAAPGPAASVVASSVVSAPGATISQQGLGGSNVSVQVPADAFTSPVNVSVTSVNTSVLNNLIPTGTSTVAAFGVTFSGDVTPAKPVTLTVYNPNIIQGATVYKVGANGLLTKVNATVTNGQATISFTTDPQFVVVAPFTVNGLAIPAFVADGSYSYHLAAVGGNPPYTWTMVSGSLPQGLNLTSDGVISGTPTQLGKYTFAVKVVDTNGVSADATYTLTIVESGFVVVPTGGSSGSSSSTQGTNPTFGITTSALSMGVIGRQFSDRLQTADGTGPYTWSVISGSLPTGLTLDAAKGIISGKPQTAGTSTFAISVKDTNDLIATQSYAIDVLPTGQRAIVANGKTLEVANSFVSHHTTYMPIWYVMQVLDQFGIKGTWNGHDWKLTASSVTAHVSQQGVGNMGIYLNGTLVQNVQGIYAKDPAHGNMTTYMPIYWIMQVLKQEGIRSSWNGVTWNMTFPS